MLYKMEENVLIIITWNHCVPNIEHEVIKDYKYNMISAWDKILNAWILSDRIIQTERKRFGMFFIPVMTHLFYVFSIK